MRKVPPPASPDAYVAAIRGWRRELVELLRAAARKSKVFEEQIKWGHLVYFANGPVGLIRAEENRVLFGFWRGKRLVETEPRLKPGGKYEMATLDFREGDTISAAKAARLMREAIALNQTIGDPTKAAPKPTPGKAARAKARKPSPARAVSTPSPKASKNKAR